MLFRNRMLGGVSFLPLFDTANEGAGGGAAPAGGAEPGAAAAPAAAGAAAPAAAAAAPGGAAPAAGTVDPAAAAAAATLAGGGQDPAAAAAAAAATGGKGFPENWRDLVAGDDKKLLGDLAKYTDPTAMYKSLRDLQGQISSGKLKAAVEKPANATPEQMVEFRKANGLPDSPEAYVKELKLSDGIVVGEADKPLVADFAKAMFESGATQGEMDRAVSWYYATQDRQQGQIVERDGEFRTTAQADLMGEWKTDYKANMNAVGALLAGVPEDLRASMLGARTADGRLVGDLPGFNKWLATMSREINPAATIVPPGGNSAETIATEISTIEKSMYIAGKPNPAYWNGEAGAKMQTRYRELVDARDKMAKRAGG